MSDEEKAFRKGRGRPGKLTPELQKKIVGFLLGGAYVETAAAAAGISKETFYDWLKQGAVQKKGRYRDFSDAVEKALADAELRDLQVVDASATGRKSEYLREKDGSLVRDKEGQPILVSPGTKPNWKASAWRLERRHPRKWGKFERLEHWSEKNTQPEALPADEERRRVNAVLQDPEALAAAKVLRDKMARKPTEEPGDAE